MKKHLLFSSYLMLMCVFTHYAQTSGSTIPMVYTLGQQGNMFSCAFGAKNYIWTDPTLNTVIHTHRGGSITGDPNSGYLRYDISKDGGVTWTNNAGPLFTNPLSLSDARYPQAVIYNPAGNTITDSAYVSYFAPASKVDWQGNWWNSVVYGSSKIGTPTVQTQREDTFNVNFTGSINEEFFLTQQGNTYTIIAATDSFSNHYLDTMYVLKGAWNNTSKDFDYTRQSIYVPVSAVSANPITDKTLADYRIAFAPNGQTGYIALLAHNTSYTTIDSSLYPIVYKTTNGGTTWTGPVNINIANAGALLTTSSPLFSCGTELDLAVDVNGDPHIITTIGKGTGNLTGTALFGSSIVNAAMSFNYGEWGVFDISSSDGGNTFYMTLLAKPHRSYQIFDGTAPIIEYVRPQISTNYANDKIFYHWFSTDTTLHPADTANSHPDAYMKGYDITTHLWTDSIVSSRGIANADGEMTYANAPFYVFEPNTGVYEFPYTFVRETVPGNSFAAGQIKYLGGVTVNDAAFGKIGNSILTDILIVDPPHNMHQPLEVYPNPTKGHLNLLLTLKVDEEKILCELLDINGKKVFEKNFSSLHQGEQMLNLNVNNLPRGIYLLRFNGRYYQANQKIILTD